jgi:hypothetical protein
VIRLAREVLHGPDDMIPAVNVLPVPGLPCKSMIRPFPFPDMISSLFPARPRPCFTPRWEVLTVAKALTRSFMGAGSTSLSNSPLFHFTGDIPSTKRLTIEDLSAGITRGALSYVLHFFSVR